MRYLLDEQGGDAQAAAFEDVALDQVGQDRAVIRSGARDVVDAGPGVGAEESVQGAEAFEAVGLVVQRLRQLELAPGVRR